MADMKLMDIKEFVKEGFLQEVNRQFLHPLGLALSVDIDKEGEYKFKGIWDCRESKDGIEFGNLDKESNKIKADNIKTITEQRAKDRMGMLGFIIQPIGHVPEKGPNNICII